MCHKKTPTNQEEEEVGLNINVIFHRAAFDVQPNE